MGPLGGLRIPHIGEWDRNLTAHSAGEQLESKLETCGHRLHSTAQTIDFERNGFLDWLCGRIGTRLQELGGCTALLAYESQPIDALIGVLRQNQRIHSLIPGTRAFREELNGEHSKSVAVLAKMIARLRTLERDANETVYKLYCLTRSSLKLWRPIAPKRRYQWLLAPQAPDATRSISGSV